MQYYKNERVFIQLSCSSGFEIEDLVNETIVGVL